MHAKEKEILTKFRDQVSQRMEINKVILFGSRARGEAGPQSDVDVVIILKNQPTDEEREFISDCAWEAGYPHGLVIVPIVFSQEEWEFGPERYSLLVKAVQAEGVPI